MTDVQPEYKCNDCNIVFKSNKALKTHLTKSSAHLPINLFCKGCKKYFANKSRLMQHLTKCSKLKSSIKSKNKLLVSVDSSTSTHLTQTNDQKLQKIEQKLEALQESINNKVNNVNNVYIQNNTIINVKTVLDRLPTVRDEDILSLLRSAPYEAFDSSESLGQYLSNKYLNNRLLKTNSSRNTLAWKNEKCTIIKDKGAQQIGQKITKLGSESVYFIDKKLRDFNEKMDQTNPSHIMDINNKDSTVCSLKTQDINFSLDLGKAISKYTDNTLSSFKENNVLPPITIENFKSNLKQYFANFGSALKRHNIDSFFDVFIFEFGLKKTNPSNDWHLFHLQELLRERKINFFVLGNFGYILSDSDTIYVDADCAVLSELTQAFLKNNILKNASKDNKACYFKFTNKDICTLTDATLFNQFAKQKLKSYL